MAVSAVGAAYSALTLTSHPLPFCKVSPHLHYPQFRRRRRRPESSNFPPKSTILLVQGSAARDLFSSRRSGSGSGRRRNALREKLTRRHDLDQVRVIPPPSKNPKEELDDVVADQDKLYLLDSWFRRKIEERDSGFSGIDSGPVAGEDNKMLERESSDERALSAGKLSSLVHSIRQAPHLKALPWSGIIILCSLCILGVVAKGATGSRGGEELTREEVEMLRRKKKSRVGKEKVDKGSVEVLRDVQMVSDDRPRPQLDRDELMKCIDEQVEKSEPKLVLPGSSHHHGLKDPEFERKVREIREMARHARELEKQDHAQNDKIRKGNEITSEVPVAEGREVEKQEIAQNDKSKLDGEQASVVHVAEGQIDANSREYPNTMPNGLEHGKEIEISSPNIDKSKESREYHEDSANLVPDGEASDVPVTIRYQASGNEDNGVADAFGSLKEIPALADNSPHRSNSNSQVNSLSGRNKEVKQNVTDTKLVGKESTPGASVASSAARRTPKIVKSVKEAKEYLKEHGIQIDKLQSRGEPRNNSVADGVNSLACPNDDKLDVRLGQKIKENKKAAGPSLASNQKISHDVDVASLQKGSAANPETNFHDVDARSAAFPREINEDELLGKLSMDLPHDTPTETSEELSGVRHVVAGSNLDNVIANTIACPSEGLRSAVNAESTSSETIKSENLSAKQWSRDYTCGGDKKVHTSCNSGNNEDLESQELSYGDVFSNIYCIDTQKNRLVNASDNSTELKGKRHFDSKPQSKASQDGFGANGHKVNNSWRVRMESEHVGSLHTESAVSSSEDSSVTAYEFSGNASVLNPKKDGGPKQVRPLTPDAPGSKHKHGSEDLPRSEESILPCSAGPGKESEALQSGCKSWLQDNFEQFVPVIEKIATGFRENYMLAKEEVQQSTASADISELALLGEDEELSWMNDEKLREIVFQVRENELAGRDPFHSMDSADQQVFFKGLEAKAEKINEKLSDLHLWVHSRIENLDYGADGISLDDPLEKIVPRWKGPPVDRIPGFLDKELGMEKASSAENVGQLDVMKGKKGNRLQESDLPLSGVGSTYHPVDDKTPGRTSKGSDTLIECSDGSSRHGKKTGKEHWEHTKKWSQGFLEVYNAETDPEVKSIMKDMGKGLDRWITEKEIQDVADLMTRIPKRKRRYIQKKMDKLKKEVDMYGPQAVVSKYREYADEKEEDYLWWLDLQFVLCIELYTVENGVQKIGFYSLEMAADLELQPKQFHVIAFQDPGDSKNFCYILQTHLDMLGSGKCFVVARPPKDAFREAKADGFNITVIKKGELKFNVDQTLEEVEEQITEVGSKIYHDKIMKERGVDIRTLMKGVIVADKAARR